MKAWGWNKNNFANGHQVDVHLKNGNVKTWRNPTAAWRWLRNHRNLKTVLTVHLWNSDFDQWQNWDVL